jgi:AcrR family transcriptional regulator
MPRQVDHDDRRDQIVTITVELIASGGPKAVTMREVARRLGGSVTLVTHYFPTRDAIFEGVAARIIELGRSEAAAMEAGTDEPTGRLHRYLEWALPTRPEAMVRELARIRLLAERHAAPGLEKTARGYDESMREDLREHLADLVPADRRESVVELLRVFITGVIVLAVEHPDDWPAERQLVAAESMLRTLGLVTPDATS